MGGWDLPHDLIIGCWTQTDALWSLLQLTTVQEDHGHCQRVLTACHRRPKWVVGLFPGRELISPQNMNNFYLEVFSILSSLREIVIYVAGSLLYLNNIYMSKDGCVVYMFHLFKITFREVVFTFPRLENMGFAQFSDFPPEDYV